MMMQSSLDSRISKLEIVSSSKDARVHRKNEIFNGSRFSTLFSMLPLYLDMTVSVLIFPHGI